MLHYQIQGEGPVWVFLHGFLESSTMWAPLQLQKLPIRCVFIDLPGHGQSALPEANPSIQAMAQEVQRVLGQLEIKEFTVVGHSMGAYVGLELSKFVGFQKLLLLNSNCWTDTEQKKQDRLRVATLVHKAKLHFIREAIPSLFQAPDVHAVFVQQLIEEAKLMSAEAIAYAALAMRERSDFTNLVNDNPEQFIFIHGRHDKLVSVEEIEAKIKGPKIHLLDCGHMGHIEADVEVRQILRELI